MRETPAFFDANPELKEACRKPVKNLPAEPSARAKWRNSLLSTPSFCSRPQKNSKISKMSSRESLRKK
jgi:hypothetical protein